MTTTADRPGTRLFAPQARLVDADANKIVGTSETRLSPSSANLDLVSAKVTLAINNVCTMQVVLNNQRNQDGRPVFPPWKYNNLEQIKFGQRLRLDMRYGADPWHKMILARVTDLQFSFPSGGPAQITVSGEDLLSLLKTKPEQDKRYSNVKEDEIVRSVLERSKSRLEFIGVTPDPGGDPLKGPLVEWPELEPLRSVTHANSTSYLAFLQGLAERMDFELFVDFTKRLVIDSDDGLPADANEVKLHFEPCRSVVEPREIIDLTWGHNLIELTPKLKVWDLLTEVTVGGTRHGSRKPQRKTITASHEKVKADLHEDPSYRVQVGENRSEKVELLGAAAVRDKFFAKELGEAPPNKQNINEANLDPARLELKAIATLRNSYRKLLTAEGSTIGFPPLRPGTFVRLGGMYPPFDGIYYVTQTTHTFDANGYRTQFSLRRPGFLDPAKYPDKEAAS